MRCRQHCAWLGATWKKQLKLEGAILVGRLAWAVNEHVEVSEIVIVRNGADARDSVFTLGTTVPIDEQLSSRLGHQALSLLDDSLWESHGDCSQPEQLLGCVQR